LDFKNGISRIPAYIDIGFHRMLPKKEKLIDIGF
jgi:hypothetical protein